MLEIDALHFETIDSTNNWAKAHIQNLHKNKLTVIVADEQTAGRGRRTNRWTSPEGNLYASFCFFTNQANCISNVTQVMAISLAETLTEMGFTPMLKWPNDILLSGKKCAGILCEAGTLDDLTYAIVGIGLNINMSKQQIAQYSFTLTSLLEEAGRNFKIENIRISLQKYFRANLITLMQKGFEPFLESYKTLLRLRPGDRIKFHHDQLQYQGAFHSIQNNGSLNLLLDTGEVKNFISGEIY